MGHLYEKSAYELNGMLRNKQCSAVEIVQSIFKRINEMEDTVGAYLTVCEEEAINQAVRADDNLAKGIDVTGITGIPIGIKDNISTIGIKTTCASKMLENYVPPFDAHVIKKIKSAGGVITGKLNMDEFAMGSSTENSYFKPAHNPCNTEYVPGGSSGGSAAAVAAGEAVLTLGSDTGGSIRQPASYCGVVGLKPTYGSVSRYGLVAFASSLDQIGPMGKSVKDVTMLYDSICGYDHMDATSVNREYPSILGSLPRDEDEARNSLRGVRVGVPHEYFEQGVSSDVAKAVMSAVGEMERAGAIVKKISLPSTQDAISAYYVLSSAEASSNLARYDGVKYGYRTPQYETLDEMYECTRSEGFGAEVKRRIMLGTFVLSSGYYDAYYGKAKKFQQRTYMEFANAFNDVDVIATPTTPTVAFKLGQNSGDPLQMYMNDVCTVTVNIAGLPAISLPCGESGGLPIGLQLIGGRFSEPLLLKTADATEQLILK